MSNCNCEGKTINLSLGCCQPVLAPIENYYTKYQIDKMLSGGTSGCCITPEEVDEKIESAKTEIESEIPSLSGYATEQWVEDQHYISGVDLSDYALKSEIPTSNSGLTNDAGYITSAYTYDKQTIDEKIPSLSGYATEQWVLDKHYITGVDLSNYATLQDIPTVPTNVSYFTNDAGYITSAYTYDKQTIDEKVASGGTFDPTQYYTTGQTDALLADKLDVSAYTPTDLSQYWTSAQTQSAITEATKVDDFTVDTSYNRYFPSSSTTASYTDGATKLVANIHRGGQNWFVYIYIQVIDEGGNTTSGSCNEISFSSSNINPLPDILDATKTEADWVYTYTYTPKEGYRISFANIYQQSDNTSVITDAELTTTTKKYEGGNVADVIENTIEPELQTKQNKLTQGTGISINNNVISTTTNFWCGDYTQWASVSGNPDTNTIYLVHE